MKTGFEACKECFEVAEEQKEEIDIEICRESSEVCPEIPKDMANAGVMAYLKQEISRLDYKPQPESAPDMVNHPPHYKDHPSGVECITITEHMTFNIGNAVKYLWRVDGKDNPFQDLDKAIWYINREIKKRKNKKKNG